MTDAPKEAPKDELAEMRKEMRALRAERDTFKDAYFHTEATLSGSTLYKGKDERWPDKRPILAVKLAKELMGKANRPAWIKPAIPVPPVRDYYLELVEWLGAGHCRTVRKGPDHLWHIRDEARSIEISGQNLNLLLKSQDWDKFRIR